MAGWGVHSRHFERSHADETVRGKSDPECAVNGSPSRSTCWTAKDYVETTRPEQENLGLEPLPAEMILR